MSRPGELNRLNNRPEDFLEMLRRAKRGRLKLYIGFAAGVGKTYRMLEEAHALKRRGVDVVLGFVETHGRAETQALIAGLPEVPRKVTQYRGVALEEMDLDGLLERRPEITVVDEIAHTNVPGSRNRRRYQDVLALLDAGINVIGAFNIQHLESLNDVVQRVTGVAIRETVPDSFLKRADQVVNLDLAVEDLIERLQGERSTPPTRSPGRSSTSSPIATWPPCGSWRCARWPRASTAVTAAGTTKRSAPPESRRAAPRAAASGG